MNNMKNACLRTKSGDAVMLKGIAIEGDCRGLLFEATVVQRYTNPTARNMEVIYNFPLPYAAVLLGVDVVLGGKPLSGCHNCHNYRRRRCLKSGAGESCA